MSIPAWIFLGLLSGKDLDLFSAESIFGTPTQVSYASRGIANSGPQEGTVADNVGNTQAPSGVPEPGSVLSIGSGLILLGVVRRKAKSA